MNQGKSFEKRVEKELRLCGYWPVWKLPTGARVIGKGKAIQIKSHPDFIVGSSVGTIVFDAKTLGEKHFNLNSRVFRKEKVHQYKALNEAHSGGWHAGYLVHFRGEGVIAWMPIDIINYCKRHGEKSLNAHSPLIATQSDKDPIDLEKLIEEAKNL
jgi:hypothetical protein